MNLYSLSLIIKENEAIPNSVTKRSHSSLDRRPNYLKATYSLSETDYFNFSRELSQDRFDFFFVPAEKKNVKPKLVVFDMDSTLIQNEVIDEMAMLFGKGEEVKLITERAMNGELDFDGSLKARVSLLKGLNQENLKDVLKVLKVTKGVPEFLQTCKRHGVKSAVVSGGFQFFANHFKELLGLDYAYANTLEFQDGQLTGNVTGEIVNGNRKAILLQELAAKEGLLLDETIAIGDGANDIPMLKKAGLGFAFHAKEKVKREIQHQINFGTMDVISYYLDLE